MKMKCVKCNKKAGISLKHLGGSLCPGCFAEVIEKRIRRAFREHKWISPKDCVLVIDDNTLKARMAIYIISSIFKDRPFNFCFKKGSIDDAGRLSAKYDKVIIPWNLDDEIELSLKAVFEAKKPEKTNFIKPLLNISDEEIEYFAKIKNIKGEKKAKTKLGKMLDDLEKRYPGSKFGLLKSFLD